VSKSTVKKEKNTKEKMRTAEIGSQGNGDVDDHSKSSVETKSHVRDVMSSEQSELPSAC